jgi:hypothetical protein
MTVTVNTKAYAFDTNPTPESARHVGPANTYAVRDYLDLRRVAAKPTTTSLGVARAFAKFVKTVTLSDASKKDVIVTVEASLPIGMSDADSDSIRDDLGDFLISTNGADLFKKAKINQ